MRLNSRFLLYGIFALFVILSAYLVMAAPGAPTGLIFNNSQNNTANYDNDGTVFLNWTAGAGDAPVNYTIFIKVGSGSPFTTSKNTSATGFRFTNTTQANYSFIVQAHNATAPACVDGGCANSTANFWMVIDTTLPALLYTSNTETNASVANRNWILANVTATDTNNVSSRLTFSLYYANATLVNQTQYSYPATGVQTINWTSLAEGEYVFNVTANDSATNSNSTTSRTFYLDRTVPTATASCSPSTIYEEESFPCSCSGTDSLTTVTTSASSNSGSTTDTSMIGFYTYTCTATDAAANSATDTETYTVLNIGGGGPAGPPKKTNSWTKITPGAATIMKDFDSEIGVKQIQVEVNNEAQNVKITVTKYDGKPAEVSVSKSGKVYQYLQINAQNLGTKLDKATVQFRVEKSWASSNGLDKDEIAVYKFDETVNKWNELQTTFSSEDSTYYYYDAELDSFSYFAISEKTLVSGEGTGVTGGAAPEEGRSLIWLWILIALVIGTAVWWMMRKR